VCNSNLLVAIIRSVDKCGTIMIKLASPKQSDEAQLWKHLAMGICMDVAPVSHRVEERQIHILNILSFTLTPYKISSSCFIMLWYSGSSGFYCNSGTNLI
jgi:hypothetical protein